MAWSCLELPESKAEEIMPLYNWRSPSLTALTHIHTSKGACLLLTYFYTLVTNACAHTSLRGCLSALPERPESSAKASARFAGVPAHQPIPSRQICCFPFSPNPHPASCSAQPPISQGRYSLPCAGHEQGKSIGGRGLSPSTEGQPALSQQEMDVKRARREEEAAQGLSQHLLLNSLLGT